jgi:hypothetical protein
MATEAETPKSGVGSMLSQRNPTPEPSEAESPWVEASPIASSEHAKRVASRERAVARRQAELAKEREREARIRAQLAKEQDDLALTRQGMRRSFWTGKVVPVRGSRRARAHQRRLRRSYA